MAKKGIAVRIAIGKPKGDLGAPSGLEAAGAPPARRAPWIRRDTPPPPDTEEENEEEPDMNEEEGEGDEEEDQTQPGGGGGTAPSPEALHYHDDLQRCDMCTHFGQDNGYCEILQQTVQAEGGCASYEAAEQGGGMGEGGGMEGMGPGGGYQFG